MFNLERHSLKVSHDRSLACVSCLMYYSRIERVEVGDILQSLNHISKLPGINGFLKFENKVNYLV